MSQLSPDWFRRQDESADALFYMAPRLVAHIDDAAIAALGEFFRRRIPEAGEVLDLMSSYLTHLPPEVLGRCRRVVGLGLNEVEMAANSQLSEHVVHDLNQTPAMPLPDEAFDAALCTVSVQYLLRPVEVFADVRRVLRPGGHFLVSFSNRCFPTKAVAVWLDTGDAQHATLVRLYFERSGGWQDVEALNLSPHPISSDPLYMVCARKAVGSEMG